MGLPLSQYLNIDALATLHFENYPLDLTLNITKTKIISVRKLQQQRELELLPNNLDGRGTYGYYD
jgi:hypothetical protein